MTNKNFKSHNVATVPVSPLHLLPWCFFSLIHRQYKFRPAKTKKSLSGIFIQSNESGKPRKLKTLQRCGTKSSYRACGSQKGQIYQVPAPLEALERHQATPTPSCSCCHYCITANYFKTHGGKLQSPSTPLPTEELLSS